MQNSASLNPYQQIFNKSDLSQIFLQAFENFISDFGCQIPAKVEKVHMHEDSKTGTVDVQPLIRLQSADGQTVERSILHQVPYFRLQGGDSALIIDPQKGDIGQLILNGRDVSGLSCESDPQKPASFRLFDPNDCFFLPALFSKAPKQSILANDEGWKIQARENGKIILEAKEILIEGDLKIKGNVSIEGDLTVKGKITAQQDILAGTKSISLQNHAHPVSAAPGITGEPQ